MDLKFALQRPFTDIKKLLIGILLSVIPLVNFFSFGYQIECARLTLKKKKNLPEWKNWKELFINGLLYFIIVLIYFIPVIFVSILWMGKELLKGILSPSFNADLLTENEIIKLSSVLILVFFILYWVYGALINYSSNFKFKDAFDFKKISTKVFTGKFVGAALASFLITYLFSYVFSFLPGITIPGLSIFSIVEPIGGFISGIMAFTLLAESFR